MSNNVIDLQEIRDSNEPWYAISAMCIACDFRWVGGVRIETSLFYLECPNCGEQKSFASVLPEDYSRALLNRAEEIEKDE